MATLSPLPQPPSDRITIGDGRRARLLRALGKGSVSTVYRAVLETPFGIERPVAMKVFHAVATDEVDAVCRVLRRTASRAACVRHPNVVATYEFGLAHSQAFIVEELVEGVSLATFVERVSAAGGGVRRVSPDLALFIASEVAEALSGARTARGPEGMQVGMLHLGLHAREVLLSWRGEVKVSDFEIGTARAASSSVRSLRAVASRASSMAPEVAQGSPGDARSDVFSLGVLLRELLVGPRFPASGVTNADAIRLAREGYMHPMTFRPVLPDGLAEVLARAVAVDPDARYPNATALGFDLRRVALAMGVGDGRWFLRSALERAFAADADPDPEAEPEEK
jgi:serine/threonine-protein kinase